MYECVCVCSRVCVCVLSGGSRRKKGNIFALRYELLDYLIK